VSARVYYAEDRVFDVRRFPGVALADARGLVAKYVDGVDVVRQPRGTSGSGWYQPPFDGEPATIRLARDAGLPLVLHELAHALTWQDERGHGPAFRAMYVRLVRDEMSPWWARRLAASFRKAGYRDD
jgi:hypothetical protein